MSFANIYHAMLRRLVAVRSAESHFAADSTVAPPNATRDRVRVHMLGFRPATVNIYALLIESPWLIYAPMKGQAHLLQHGVK